MPIDEILKEVSRHQTRYVTVTGGEPLAQKDCLILLDALIAKEYSVSLETSGSIDLTGVNKQVSIIMDIKTPSSGEVTRNRWQNLTQLDAKDEIKFVIGDMTDFNWAAEILDKHIMPCPVLFSPSYHELSPSTLAEWIIERGLAVRLQVQLHKILWGEVAGR